ncbi:MAG: PP2C family protein-serine/threonine phosphatase [Candidatus Riflebacteria bacterium]|nr:PP2C family protein-serine/threonine phosphatase [Candidatus Riflebacteria bacterium]
MENGSRLVPLKYLGAGVFTLATAIGMLFLQEPAATRYAPGRVLALFFVVFGALVTGIISYWTYSRLFPGRPATPPPGEAPPPVGIPDFSDTVLQPQLVVGWFESSISRLRDRCTSLERISQLLGFMDYSQELHRQLRVALQFTQELFPDACLLIFLPDGPRLHFEIGSSPHPTGGVQFLAPEDHLVQDATEILRDQIDLPRLNDMGWQSFALPRRAGREQAAQAILPLSLWNRIRGLLLFHPRRTRGLTGDELVIANLIARQIAIFLDNHVLYQEHLDQQRLHQEVEIARSVQTSALPRNVLAFPGFDIHGVCNPSREISGDYYDLIPRGDGRLAVVIADVSGKGLPAALFLSKIQTLVRSAVDPAPTPAALLTTLSRQISRENLGTLFATMLVAFLTPGSPRVAFASAGHCRPLVVRTRNEYVEDIPFEVGIPLGLFDTDEGEYTDMEVELLPADGFLLYTDGLTDATNRQRERYGMEKLRLSLENAPAGKASEVVVHLMAGLNRFKGTAPLEDDTTIVYVKWEPVTT